MSTFTPFPPRPGSGGGGSYDDTAIKARVGETETVNRTQGVTLDDHGRRILTIEETPPLDLGPIDKRLDDLEAGGVVGPAGPQGPVGPAGANGGVGPAGERGPAGIDGQPGRDGVAGAQGIQGQVGPEGPIGPAGAQGAQGVQGVAGADGAPGAQGPVGPRGLQGPPGADAPPYDASALIKRVEDVEKADVDFDRALDIETDARTEGDRLLGVRVKALEDGGGVAGPAGPQGPAGPAGPAGPIGPAGADGARGLQGLPGADGAAGRAGPAGADGGIGPQGPAGPVGPAGADGLPGAAGGVGPAGPAGADGAPGADGARGLQGLPGADGAIGQEGPRGLPGADGAAGARGPAGADGAVGPQGPVGPAGERGLQGLPGADGARGPAGADGAPGVDGAVGPQGPVGPEGPRGLPGVDGAAGARGPAGADGAQGERGLQGLPGAEGAAGPQGPAGPAGPIGPAGPPGPAGPGSGGSSASVTEVRPWIVHLPTSTSYANANQVTFRTAGIVAGDQIIVRGTLPGGPVDETLTVSAEVLDDPVYNWLTNLGPYGFSLIVLQPDAVEGGGQVYITPRLALGITLGGASASENFRVEFTGRVAEVLGRGQAVATFETYAAGRTTDAYDPVRQTDLGETLGVVRGAVGEVLALGPGVTIRTGLTKRVHDLEQSGGTAGPAGPQGPAGAQGERGLQGVQGERGLPGADGAVGAKGDTGAQGLKGDAGQKGDAGAQGIQGPKGDTGAKGDQGLQGIQGPKGDKGDNGAPGPSGSGSKRIFRGGWRAPRAGGMGIALATAIAEAGAAGAEEFYVEVGGGGASGVAQVGNSYTTGGAPGDVRRYGPFKVASVASLDAIPGVGGSQATSTSTAYAQNAGSRSTCVLRDSGNAILNTLVADGGRRVIDANPSNSTTPPNSVIASLHLLMYQAWPTKAVPGISAVSSALATAPDVFDGPAGGGGSCLIGGTSTNGTLLNGGNGGTVRYSCSEEQAHPQTNPGGTGSGTTDTPATAGGNPYPNSAGTYGSGGGGNRMHTGAVAQNGADGGYPSGGGGACTKNSNNTGATSSSPARSGAGGDGFIDLLFWG